MTATPSRQRCVRRAFGTCIAFALFLVLPAGPAAAAAPPGTVLAAEQQAFLDKLSLARARTELRERVHALRLRHDVTIGVWAERDVERDRALRQWLRARPRHGTARRYSDQTGESDVRVEPHELREFLTDLRQRCSGDDADAIKPETITEAARDWPIVWATGSAALGERTSEAKPVGWDDVRLEGLQVVRRAAEADALAELITRAGRLKVTNARRLSEFLDSSDELRAAVRAAIEKTATKQVDFAPDQVAVAEASLGITDLMRILSTACEQQYQGESFRAADFREMTLINEHVELRGIGLASPPPQYRMTPEFQLIELDAPGWIHTTADAVGRFDATDDPSLDTNGRIQAARWTALDGLRRNIEALAVRKDVTLEQFLAMRPELKDDVVVFLSGARLVNAPKAGPEDIVEARVELPLAKLWDIVRRGMRTIEVEPAELATTRPATEPERTPRVREPAVASDAPDERPARLPPRPSSPATQPGAAKP
ncbi:MAG: hypothetical protein AB7Q17_15790 [Phycisphaerae bacterium]